MGINRFFEETLGATVRNPRWSWGAIQREGKRVFLRVWEDQITPHGKLQKVQIDWKQQANSSPGYSARRKHLAQIRDGAPAFGVLARAVDPDTTGTRVIASFEPYLLLKLGRFIEDEAGTHAIIKGPVPVSKVMGPRRGAGTATISLDDLISCLEGKAAQVSVRVRVRCTRLIKRAREVYRSPDGKLRCEICRWHKPDDRIAADIVELHHLRHVSQLPMAGVEVTMKEAIAGLVPLCPCCHRMAHSRIEGNLLTLDELKEIIPKYAAEKR